MEKPPFEYAGILPENINELIANNLILANYPGTDTEKYFIRGYPHLLVRHNPEGYPFDKEREQTARIFNELPEHGIATVPYIPVEHDEKPYVITLNVSGRSLDNILVSGKGDELAATIDTTWANLATYLISCREKNLAYAGDIYTPDQYVFGTILDEGTPQLWLVDLGDFASEFLDTPSYYSYEGEILDLTEAILAIENHLKDPLVKSRAALEVAYNKLPIQSYAEHLRNALKSGNLAKFSDNEYAAFFGIKWWR